MTAPSIIPAAPAANRWRDFAPRLVSSLVLAPSVLAAIWVGGVLWQAVLTALAIIAVMEWMAVCGAVAPQRAAMLGGLSIPAAWAVATLTGNPLWAFAAPLALAAITGPLGTWRAGPWQAGGIIYVGFGYAALLGLRASPGGFGDVAFVMFTVWGCDVGAYLTGRLIGGPKIAPALSPGKTWAGAAGGLAGGLALAFATATALGADPRDLTRALSFAAAMAVLSQAGDLLESALKRQFGVKDSGHLIPGHGGMLDRVDGLLAAAPAAMLLRLTAHGVQMWQ